MADFPDAPAIIQALDAAVNWSTSADVRSSATQFLEQVKEGDPRKVAESGFSLARHSSSHVSLFGFQLLQHVTRNKWSAFSPDEHRQMSALAFELLSTFSKPQVDRSIRSKSAALLADIVRQEGPAVWKELLPALISMAAATPTHAEMAALLLQFLPEDITVHNEDLEGDRRRQWLLGLTFTLPQVLPFLCTLLERHFSEALGAVQQGNVPLGKEHAAVVSTALASVGAYAEWAPVSALHSAKLIDACGYLLGASEFRLPACDVLKQIAARRRQQDNADAFDAALCSLVNATVAAAQLSLQQLGQRSKDNSQWGEEEFAERLCEVLVALTPTNLHRVVLRDDTALPRFLDVCLLFFRSPSFGLHSLSLPLWTVLLRESLAALGTPQSSLGVKLAKDKGKAATCVPSEHCAALLDIVVVHLPRETDAGEEQVEQDILGSSTSTNYAQYRSKLLEVARLVTAQQPLISASKAAAFLDSALSQLSSSADISCKTVVYLEAAQVFLECCLAAVPETDLTAAAAFSAKAGVECNKLELVLQGVMNTLLSLNWAPNGPLNELHGHLLDSLGPFCRHNPTAARLVISKLFELLQALPTTPLGSEPLGRPEKAEDKLPRLQICTSILRLCRAAASALTPHLKTLLDSIAGLRQQLAQREGGRILIQGELILLGEGLLAVAAASGSSDEAWVHEWMFAPVRQQWTDPSWQQRCIQSTETFLRLLACLRGSADEADFWFLYHSLMLFERCTRRPPTSDGGGHPMAAHLQWITPPLVQVTKCLHTLWRPDIRQALPPALSTALEVGAYEKAVILGESTGGAAGGGAGGAVSTPATAGTAQRSQQGPLFQEPLDSIAGQGPESSQEVITKRNWLKGVRDNAYSFLGLAAAHATGGFFSLPSPVAQEMHGALLEGLSAIEVRHLKLLLKLAVSPLVRFCPKELWPVWLGPLLPSLLRHCGVTLAYLWNTKMSANKPTEDSKAPSVKDEMFDEKMLRDLSREFCALLVLLPHPLPLSTPDPVPIASVEAATKPAEAPVDSLFWRLLETDLEATHTILLAAVEAMHWPDTEAAHKAVSFCTAAVLMPELTSASARATDANGVGALTSSHAIRTMLLETAGRGMFLGSMQALTLESNSSAQADLLGLMREIYLRLSPFTNAPKEVLLSLPGMSDAKLAALDEALRHTGSVKEQRAAFRALMQQIGGSQLRALATQRSNTAITNVSGAALGTNAERAIAKLHSVEPEGGDGAFGIAAVSTAWQ